MKERVELSIYRQDPATEEKGHYDNFEVPYVEGMVVLDAVRYVQEKIDTTLSIRWNCKAAKCGSCAAEINGTPKLLCKTRVEGLGRKVTVSPMGAYPLIKDLVTDVSENWVLLRRIPKFSPREDAGYPWKMQQAAIEKSQEFRKCIECFLCQDVCHVIREHYTPYFGPRHVVKVASLDTHPMDTLDRSKFMNKEGGLGFCNVVKCCTEVCPEHIHITDNAIIPEKEMAIDLQYDPIAALIRKRKKRRAA